MKTKFAGILALLLIGSSAAQGPLPGEIRDVAVARASNGTQVQVTLSTPTQPKVIVANDPPRLVLELTGTAANARQQEIPVGQDGIKGIRIGLHSANPPVTRVVVDLETPRAYGLAMEGNKVVLTVLPAVSASHGGSGAPGAAGVPLFGRLHSHRHSAPSLADTVIPAPVPPAPPSGPPITLAQSASAAGTSTAQTSSAVNQPSAKHPNYGSLQEGTVFPSMGQPGAGVVPATVGSSTSNTQQIAASTTQTSLAQSSNQSIAIGSTGSAQQRAVTVQTGSVLKSQPPAPKTITAVEHMTVTAPTQPAGAPVNSVSNSGRATQIAKPALAQSATGNASVSQTASATKPATPSLHPGAGQTQTVTAVVTTTPPPPPASIQPSPVSSAQPVRTQVAIAVPSAAQTVPNAVTISTASTSAPSTVQSTSIAPPAQAATSPGSTAATSVPPPVTVSSPKSQTTAAAETAPAPTPAAEVDEHMPVLATRQPNSDLKTSYKVKYVAEGAAYLDAGHSSGLSEGMKLQILEKGAATDNSETGESTGLRVIADLKIMSVADNSAVAEISQPTREVKPGDLAYLSTEDTESLVAQRSLSATRKYPTVISFTEGDPLEEEARAEVPRPPLPEVNRARGRFGFDYTGIVSHGMFSSTTSNVGMVIRTDFTRIGGSYWNMNGYWRGRFMATSGTGQQTLQDLINRTYTLGLTYQNPQSAWVAGVGRLYLPWATSLDTLDGGYVGRKVSDIATVGLFAGSTPDPVSWSYAPDQQMSGMFLNFQGGSFDDFHYSSTSGMGVKMLKWKIDRPFVFFENGLYYKRLFSIYNALQADKPSSNPAVTSPGAGIARSFTTLRIQPLDRLEFDVNHTYFRDVPNFDPQLIGTGLLDKFLFQGFSAGPRVEVYKQIWVYATLGKSSRSGESKSSLNQLYGVTFSDLPFRFHADLRYSKFSSSFGNGDYKAISISRNFRDNFRWEVLAGQQAFSSTLTSSNKSKFLNVNLEAPLGPHFFLQGGGTVSRGGTLNYDQWFGTFGYRFDSWHRGTK